MSYRIPEETIEEIRGHVDIVDLVSDYVHLKKRGNNYFGLCPFHAEKTPSFSVNAEKQIFHCFGCGVGGNVFTFLRDIENISFIEAVRTLAERAGVPLPEEQVGPTRGEASDVLYRANELARKYYQHLLWNDPIGEKTRAYLERRGISRPVAERFGLGYSPPEWDRLLNVAGRRALSGEALEEAGLASPRSSGIGYYDRFRDRLMFPISNVGGRTVAFGARTLEPDGEPKYLNSPETAIYRKGQILYGLGENKAAIRAAHYAIIVEGYTDLLRLVQSGIEPVVASAGTAFTPDQARLLARYAPRVIVVYDGDQAGSMAALRGSDVLLEADLDVYVVALPEGHDPDSFVRQEGPEPFLQLVERARPVLEYKLDQVGRTEDLSTVSGRRVALAALVETMARIGDEIKRNLWIKEMAERLDVKEEVLHRAVETERRRGPKQKDVETPGPATEPKGSAAQRELLRMMIGRPGVTARVAQEVGPEGFESGAYRNIARALFSMVEEDLSPDPAALIDRLQDPRLTRWVSCLTSEGFDETQMTRSLNDAITAVRRERIHRDLKEATRALKEAEQRGDTRRVDELYQHVIRLRKEEQERKEKR